MSWMAFFAPGCADFGIESSTFAVFPRAPVVVTLHEEHDGTRVMLRHYGLPDGEMRTTSGFVVADDHLIRNRSPASTNTPNLTHTSRMTWDFRMERADWFVVPDILAQHGPQVALVEISIRSVHSRRTAPTQRSAIAFARGARGGVLITSTPTEANTSSKPLVNLRSRSQITDRSRSARSPKSISKFRTCWVAQLLTGLVVAQPDAPGGWPV
jgi:hypothetical protein